MAIDERLKDLRGTGRRDFLRWATAVAAVLGLERSRLLNVINDTGGTALADTIGQRKRLLSVHMVAGNGGLANFQLIWPWPEVAKSTNGNYAFHALGKAIKATQTDTEFFYAPETPFQKLGKSKQVTLILGGTNQTHTQAVALDASAGTSMLASVAALQQVEATLLPVIAVNPITFGTAPGAPAVASVANSAGLVDLFNSAASRTLLQKPESSSLHEAYYKAFLGLNAAAGRSSLIKSYGTGKVAVNLLAQNLAAQLKPTTADLTNFGITAGTATNLTEMANTLIIANRAFKLGLCSSVILPAFRDDPHGLFAGGDDQGSDARKDPRRLDGGRDGDPIPGGQQVPRRRGLPHGPRRHAEAADEPERLAGRYAGWVQLDLRDEQRLPQDGHARHAQREQHRERLERGHGQARRHQDVGQHDAAGGRRGAVLDREGRRARGSGLLEGDARRRRHQQEHPLARLSRRRGRERRFSFLRSRLCAARRPA